MKKVIEMTNLEARNYFLKSESYFEIGLPEYFDFKPLLDFSKRKLNGKSLNDIWNKKPNQIENTCYSIYHNKDGQYSWRKFQLIHPIIYVDLVNKITMKDNWSLIVSEIKRLKKKSNIVCKSDVAESETENSDTEETIISWWEKMEQDSIAQSLQYKWIATTDLTDCYGSIYTHSIPWAIHGKDYSKAHKNNTTIGNTIDKSIQQMSYGQTNGIPQGSTLMDFLAEIVLSYGDMLISENINKHCINDYKIIRYRDDYRIFTNSKSDIDQILKIMTEQLEELNFRINTKKTNISSDIIKYSIKNDKLKSFYLEYSHLSSIQKKLLLIREYATNNPHSGTLKKVLSDFYKKEIIVLKKKPDQHAQCLSIIVDIMYNNPDTYPVTVPIISKLLSYESDNTALISINSIINKFKDLPNTEYLNIWLQRIAITRKAEIQFNDKLCKIADEIDSKIWDNSWLSFNIDEKQIINKGIKENLDIVIPKEVATLYNNVNY